MDLRSLTVRRRSVDHERSNSPTPAISRSSISGKGLLEERLRSAGRNSIEEAPAVVVKTPFYRGSVTIEKLKRRFVIRNFAATHEWVSIEGKGSNSCISDHAQDHLGDIVYVDLPEVGKSLLEGDVFCTIESVKAASEHIRSRKRENR
jgi:hypothetical protein